MPLSQFISISLIVYLMILFGSSAITVTLVHLVLSVKRSRFATEASCLGGVSVFLGMQYILGITDRYLTLSILALVVLWLSFESIKQSDGHTEVMTLVELDGSNQHIQDDIFCYSDGKQYTAIAGVRIKGVPNPEHRDSTNRSDETLHWLNPLHQYCQSHNTTFYIEALLEDGISTVYLKTKGYDKDIASAVSKAHDARLLAETYLSRLGYDHESLSRTHLYQQSRLFEAVQSPIEHEDDILHCECGFVGGLLVRQLSDDFTCNMGDLLQDLSRHHFTGKILLGFNSGKLPKLHHESTQLNDNPRQQSRVPHKIEDHKLRKTYRQMAEIEACEETGCFNIGIVLLTADDSIDGTRHEMKIGSASLNGIWAGTRTKSIAEGYLKRLLRHDVSHLRVGNNLIISGARLSALLELKPVPGISTRMVPPPFALLAEPSSDTDGISLGKIMNRGRPTSQVYKIDLDALCFHTGIYGNPGSGKTNTALHLVHEASKRGVPFLAIIPAKTEWRALLEVFPDLRIFTAGDESTCPFRFNFFDVPPGVPVQTHINNITTCFIAHWPSEGILTEHITKIFRRTYERAGWNPLTNERGRHILLTDLHKAMQEVSDGLLYGDRLKQDFTGALTARTESLLHDSTFSVMFNTIEGLSIPELLNNQSVLEMRHLTDTQRALVASLLMVSVSEYLEASTSSFKQKLKHLLVLEEAHHVLKRVGMQDGISGSHSAQRQAITTLVQLLRESRGLGLGVVLIDQLPGSLADDAVKLHGNSIIHSLKDSRERLLVGSQANLNNQQIQHLGILECGECVISEGFNDKPINVVVAEFQTCSNPSKSGYSDCYLRERMAPFYRDNPHLMEQNPSIIGFRQIDPTVLWNLKFLSDSPDFKHRYKKQLMRGPKYARNLVRDFVKTLIPEPDSLEAYCQALIENLESQFGHSYGHIE